MKNTSQVRRFIATLIVAFGVNLTSLNADDTKIVPYASKNFSDTENCLVVVCSQEFEMVSIIGELYKKQKHEIESPLKYIRDIQFDPSLKGLLCHYRGYPLLLVITGKNFTDTIANITTLCIKLPKIQAMIYIGIAGATDPSLVPGDVVVADQWYTHDVGYFLNKGSVRYKSQYSAFRNYQLGNRGIVESIPCSPALVDIARETKKFMHSNSLNQYVLNKAGYPAQILVGGNGSSGTSFVDCLEFRDYLHEIFKITLVDMESHAALTVCMKHNIPFISIRSISDKAGENGASGISDIDSGGRKLAADNASLYFKNFLDYINVKTRIYLFATSILLKGYIMRSLAECQFLPQRDY